MTLIGYARVSANDQNHALQIQALENAGCSRIFTEKMSGVKKLREQEKLLEYLRPGDTLVVWKLDRLGRRTIDLIQLINTLQEKGIHFRSLTESIDTSTPGGKFMITVFAGLAQLERDIIRERTMAGLIAARADGRTGGRPRGLSKKYQKIASAVKAAYRSKEFSRNQLMEMFNIPSSNTLYRILHSQGITELIAKDNPEKKL